MRQLFFARKRQILELNGRGQRAFGGRPFHVVTVAALCIIFFRVLVAQLVSFTADSQNAPTSTALASSQQ